MNCPVHMGVAMVAHSERRPRFASTGTEGMHPADPRSRLRTVWKCPAPGCRYVSQRLEEAEGQEGLEAIAPRRIRRVCSKCGLTFSSQVGDPRYNRCRSCYRKACNRRHRARRLRQRQEQQGRARRAQEFTMVLRGARRPK